MICPTLSWPYFAGDVGDDLVAPVLAEVDVEVRHRHPLGLRKRSKKEVVGDGSRSVMRSA
jgi:hypothetical protein